MKTSFLLFYLLAAWNAFAQRDGLQFERLKAYSTKSDQYDIGFFFTIDTVLLHYPDAYTAGNEDQISNDRSSLTPMNNYQSYNTYQIIGEMGFVNKNKYLIVRDSVNRIFTNLTCVFDLQKKVWDTTVLTRNFMNISWKPDRTEFLSMIQDTLGIIGYKFYSYDTESRLLKDSLSKRVQTSILPDSVRYYGYDQQNHLTFDSIVKYINNVGARANTTYYSYNDTFLIEKKIMAKSGLTQVWQFTRDSFMRKEYSYMAYPDFSPNYEHIELLDIHGNVIEYISLNLKNNGDTNAHFKYEFTYDNKGNVLSNTKKVVDQAKKWFKAELREFEYDERDHVVAHSLYYYIRPTNTWRYFSKNTYEYNDRSQLNEWKYYVSNDSVSWSDYQLNRYTYTDFGNPDQVIHFVWDTLINDYTMQSSINYYWEKYFYDGNIIDQTDDLPTAIYPNPSDNFFNVIFESESETDGKANVSIYNSVGETILKKTISVKPQMNQFTWDASAFPVGMYIMVLEADSKQKSFKLLKTR